MYEFFTKTRVGLNITFYLLYGALYIGLGFEITVIAGIGSILGSITYNEK